MKYTDLATRLEELDTKLARNDRDADSTDALIRRLTSQLDSARAKLHRLHTSRLSLSHQRSTTRRELDARLG
jgi:chromosome segregation ATPase